MASRQIEGGWHYEELATAGNFHADIDTRFKGLSGPLGSGKSYALVYEALFLTYLNAGCPGLIGAPTYPMLRDATQITFFSVLELEEIPHHFLKSENRVYFPETGSSILFRSMDDPERLRGTNLAWFGIDELTYCNPAIWTRLQGRLRHPKAERLEGFGVWTPKGFDWVYDLFIKKKDKDYRAYFAVPKENRYLPADFYEILGRTYDARFFEQEALGKYLDVTGGSVYHAYSQDNKGTVDYDPKLALCWSLDFNVDPMCSVIAQIPDATTPAEALKGLFNRRVHVIDEICLPDSHTEEACREFVRRTEGYLTETKKVLVVDVYGDASGSSRKTSNKSDYQIIREFFANETRYKLIYHIKNANPEVKDRVRAMNGVMRNAKGECRLLHDARCIQLETDLNQVKWKRDVSNNPIYEFDKHDPRRTHVSDALGYLVDYIFNAQRIRIGTF
jgi:hypothetical protein